MKRITTAAGDLALYPGTRIDLSKNNPMFSRAQEFSLNLTIPREPNDKIFGYKYRLASVKANDVIEAKFYFRNRLKLVGTIQLTGASEDSYEVILKGSRNEFVAKYGKQVMSQIDYGEVQLVPGNASLDEAERVEAMRNTLISPWKDWVCFPVYSKFLNKYINKWSYDNDTFASEVGCVRTVFIWLHVLIEKLFSEKGYVITENWFSESDRERMVVYNSRNLIPYNAGSGAVNIEYADLMPAWTILEVLNELENFFPITFKINSINKTVAIVADDAVTTTEPVDSLDRWISEPHTIDFENSPDGYDIGFDKPKNDESTDTPFDYTDEITGIEVYVRGDLPAGYTEPDTICLVQAEGIYYSASINEEEETVWEPVGSQILGVRSGKGDTSKQTRVYPLPNIFNSHTEMVDAIRIVDSVAVRIQVGFGMLTPGTSKDYNYWYNDFRVGFYRGFTKAIISLTEEGYTVEHDEYPMGNFLNRKQNGTTWAGQYTELRLDGDMGLRAAETLNFIDQSEEIEVKLLIHHLEAENLDLLQPYLFKGRKVLIKEMAIHYADAEEIEIDCVLIAQKR